MLLIPLLEIEIVRAFKLQNMLLSFFLQLTNSRYIFYFSLSMLNSVSEAFLKLIKVYKKASIQGPVIKCLFPNSEIVLIFLRILPCNFHSRSTSTLKLSSSMVLRRILSLRSSSLLTDSDLTSNFGAAMPLASTMVFVKVLRALSISK